MKKLYITFFFALLQHILMSQTAPYTIDNNTGKCCGGNDLGMGSSFKVFGAGQIDSVLLYHRNNSNPSPTLYIYKGNGPNPDSLLGQKSFTGVPAWTSQPTYMVRLSPPIPVKTDSVYTIYVIGVPLRHETSPSTYANGTLWVQGVENTTGDLDFAVYIGPLTVTATTKSSSQSISLKLNDNGRTLSLDGINADVNLKLYSVSGELVSETNGKSMALPALSDGLYFVHIIKDKEIYTSKIYICQ